MAVYSISNFDVTRIPEGSVFVLDTNAFYYASGISNCTYDITKLQQLIDDNDIFISSTTLFEFDEKTGTVLKYNGNSSKIVIPFQINGVTVKKVGPIGRDLYTKNNEYQNCEDLLWREQRYPDDERNIEERKKYEANGILNGDECLKKIEIEEMHIEEDTCKSTHRGTKTLLDFNRAGVPLIEIVTKPCLSSGEEAKAYLEKLRELLFFHI